MEFNDLFMYIQQYGYAALFFCLWLGIVGLPIPDEMIVMSGGFVSSLGILMPIPAFLLTYLGVVSGLSLGYVLGNVFGLRFLDKIVNNNRANHLQRSQKIIEKYGPYALILSYFIPVVRHIVPYLVGINKMPFRTYALYSYTTGFLWTLILFILGTVFGEEIELITVIITKYGYLFGAIIGVAFVFYLIKRHFKKQAVQIERSQNDYRDDHTTSR